eukprot:CAMPEP_0118853482 /NCGR_PEP_ID=MMETSP1163-20130328/2053_1 /TAXON_ID=124430 /ORGANISM="Phaeomonas parva, Strain CCMP2877" /LENGTH=57 /DNA_ID=CAMNT_0006786039 /DNA_START=445 /DNA_END=614 /DNA_ORIENTATION=+
MDMDWIQAARIYYARAVREKGIEARSLPASGRVGAERAAEEQNVRLRAVDGVVLPAA